MVNSAQKKQQGVKQLFLDSLPKVIIVGVMKGGTTSLFRYLEQHPQMVASFDKEVHFFDVNFKKGLLWYSRQFPLNQSLRRGIDKSELLNFEASPFYIFHPYALRRIAETLPSVKLIALLRDPVDRAYSHYQQITRKGKEDLSFDEAIAKEPARIGGIREKMLLDENFKKYHYTRYSYLARGRYIEQVQEMYRLFPKEQILILKSEDLFADVPLTMKEVFQFLEIPPCEIQHEMAHNRGKYEDRMSGSMREKLSNYFRPYNEQLYKFLGRDFGWQ